MKHISTIVNTILAVVLILILLSTGLPTFEARAAQQGDSTPTPAATAAPTEKVCNPDRNIHVSGTAVVNVVPDRALIQLGVQSNGRTPKEVQSRNAAMTSRVIKALKELGVEARDISTDRYVIQPLYEDWDSLRIKGYRIFNVISITIRDVDKTSEVIAAAFQAGANQVVNVEFYTSELRKYRDQAREMAITAAREKADALTKTAGAETGCVLNITENTSSYFNGWSGWGWWYGGGNNQNLWTQNAVQNAAPATSGSGTSTNGDSPVSSGQISIRAEVGVTFSLK
jgi:uncharacterized protein YggE